MTFNYDEICKAAGLEMLCRKNWGQPVAKKNRQDVTLDELYSKMLLTLNKINKGK
jgi:hypothetical protein